MSKQKIMLNRGNKELISRLIVGWQELINENRDKLKKEKNAKKKKQLLIKQNQDCSEKIKKYKLILEQGWYFQYD